jgi:hypothetical protein
MSRTAAAIREFCLNDEYSTWKAFVSVIADAVSFIREFGVESYAKDSARWDEFFLRESLNNSSYRMRVMLREVGQGAIAGKSLFCLSHHGVARKLSETRMILQTG